MRAAGKPLFEEPGDLDAECCDGTWVMPLGPNPLPLAAGTGEVSGGCVV